MKGGLGGCLRYEGLAALKMEAITSSKTWIITNKITWRLNPEVRENFRPQIRLDKFSKMLLVPRSREGVGRLGEMHGRRFTIYF